MYVDVVDHFSHTGLIVLTSQGSEFSQKQSVPQHSTVFYSTLRKSKSVSLSPSCSKWRVRTQ